MLDDGTTFQQPLFVSIPFKYLLIDATGKYIGQIGFRLRKLSRTCLLYTSDAADEL